MRRAVLLLSLLALAGCSSLHRLKQMNPSADDFNSALASEYLAYAESESEQGRHNFAERYAGKGLRAAEGKPVLPDEINKSLQPEDQEMLRPARDKLLTFLTDD